MNQLVSWLCRFTIVGGLLSSGCSGPATDVGTNTNWMRLCVQSDECGGEYECLCGRCTSDCANDKDCTDGATCAVGVAAQLQCEGRVQSSCQPVCTNDDDCDSGRACLRGACVDPLPPAVCPTEALFCEDFESDVGDTIPIVTEGNSIDRVEAFTPSGHYAVQASVTEAPSVSYLRHDFTAPQSSGDLYASVWVQVPQQPTHDVAPLAFWSPIEDSWALRLVIANAKLSVWSETNGLTGTADLIPGEWHCLGLHVVIGEADGSVEASIDGSPALSALDVDTLPMAGITAVTMGTHWAGEPVDVLVDRVIVSQAPVDCYRP